MRLRPALTLAVIVGFVAVVASSCSSGTTLQASMESAERPARGSEFGPGGSSSPDLTLPPDFSIPPDMSLPPDLTLPPDFSVPGMPDGASDCLQMLSTFSTLMMLGIFGDASQADAMADELRPALPSRLHGDLDTIVQIAKEASAAGLLSGSEMLLSEEYTAAVDAILDWLNSECADPGGFGD